MKQSLKSRKVIRRNFPSRFVVLSLALSLLAVGANCKTPKPSSITIEMPGTNFATGSNPDRVDRTHSFFAGSNNDSFTVNLTTAGLGGGNRIIALAGDGSTIDTLTASESRAVTFQGNVGMLRLLNDSVGPPLGFVVDSVTLNTDGDVGNAPQPNNAPTLANKVWSMPLAPNMPLELFFAADGGPTYFVTVTGLAGRTVDVVLDGPEAAGGSHTGTVTLNTSPGSWAIGTESAEDALTPADRGFLTKTMPANLDTLFLGVSSRNFSGHGRLSVNINSRIINLQARFWSAVPATAGQVAAITASFASANSDIYRATGGRVRIGTVRLFTTYSPAAQVPLGDPTADNIILIRPVTGLLGGAIASLPAGKEAIQLAAPPSPLLSPGALVETIMRMTFGLPVERDNNNTVLCPNSLMSERSMFQPAFCWSGNHNPSGNSNLGGTASWDRLGPQIGVPSMTTSPPRIFRNVTTVTLPLTVLTNPSP